MHTYGSFHLPPVVTKIPLWKLIALSTNSAILCFFHLPKNMSPPPRPPLFRPEAAPSPFKEWVKAQEKEGFEGIESRAEPPASGSESWAPPRNSSAFL